MSRKVSIGMVSMFLLLTLGMASVSGQPSGGPSGQPSTEPPSQPANRPAEQPSDRPSARPSDRPSAPVPSVEDAETKAVSSPTSGSQSIPTGAVPGRPMSPTAVSAQDQFRSWLASSSEGRGYAGVADQIEDIARRIDRAGVPLDVIRTRMWEAQAKRVGTAVFADALELDASHWIRVATLLGDARWPPAAKAPDFYIAASTALRNGVNEGTVSVLITWALASRGTPERASAVLMSVSSLAGLMNSVQLSRTAGLMAASRLRVGEFDDLADLLQRAAAAGLASSELLAAMEEVLGSRGTLRSLERRLFP